MTRMLRIGFLSTLYHTSHILREGKWLEKELGIGTHWTLYGTGPEMLQAFAQREIELAYMGLPPAIIGMSRGIPLVCIGGGHVEGTVMIARPAYKGLNEMGSVERVVGQFERCRIGIPAQGSIHDVIFRDLLVRCPCPGVEIVNFAWADLIPSSFLKGEIHAAIGTPPLAVLCERESDTRVVVPPEGLWPFNPSYGIVVRREILAETSLVEGFLDLHERACNLTRKAVASAAQITVRALPWLDQAFVERVYAVSPRYCASLPDRYVESTLEFLPVLKNLGYLETAPEAKTVFDTRFIRRVHPAPHHY